MRLATRPVVGLVAVVMMTVLVACGGGKKMKLVVERETVIHDPVIQSVSIDGPARLDTRTGSHTVNVKIVGDPGLEGTFDASGMFKGRDLQENPSGTYNGSFQIPQGTTGSVTVIGHLLHIPTGANAQTATALQLYVSPEPVRSGCTVSASQAFDTQLQKLTVYFDVDSDRVPEKARKNLSDNVDLLKSNPSCKIFMYGHTDLTGTEGHNDLLSARRVLRVVSLLESLGIDLERIEKLPLGSRYPAAKGVSKQHNAMNRRTELRAVAVYP